VTYENWLKVISVNVFDTLVILYCLGWLVIYICSRLQDAYNERIKKIKPADEEEIEDEYRQKEEEK